MSFKISNVVQDEANRECGPSRLSETVTGEATLDPSVPVTKVILSGSSYSVTLPLGTPGERKVVTIVQRSGGEVTVAYNSGWGGTTTRSMSSLSDTISFIASVEGWHTYDWID
jgi:hypothetical protein